MERLALVLNFGPSFIDSDNPQGFRRNLEREFIIILAEDLRRWSTAFRIPRQFRSRVIGASFNITVQRVVLPQTVLLTYGE